MVMGLAKAVASNGHSLCKGVVGVGGVAGGGGRGGQGPAGATLSDTERRCWAGGWEGGREAQVSVDMGANLMYQSLQGEAETLSILRDLSLVDRGVQDHDV